MPRNAARAAGNHDMDGNGFRQELRRRLARDPDRVVLRVVVAPGEPPVEWTGVELLRQAEALATRYVSDGERKVVLILLPHSPEMFLLHLGLVLLGHLPAILSWPTSRMDPEKYQRNLIHQLRNLPANLVVTVPRLAANLAGQVPYPIDSCEVPRSAEYERIFVKALAPEPMEAVAEGGDRSIPEAALFLQFSGGTTGAQKAVVVTCDMLTDQLERLAAQVGFTESDGVVSWLPLYHDMGLIACLWFPLWLGAPSLHLSAGDWLLGAELVFRYLSEYRGTFCWQPNFAFAYLTQQKARMTGNYALGHVRAWINCSEPVRRGSLDAFADTFAVWGVRRDQLQTSYAMAENTFAVSQSTLGTPPPTVPRSRLEGKGKLAVLPELAFSLLDDAFLSSGKLLPRTELRIVGADDVERGPEEPGEILLRSPSLFSGYWGSKGFSRTSLTEEGWHRTGDFGFVSAGELYVTGRVKDMIIVGGQNVFPEDVEAVVNSTDGIYPGRVVAFGVQDGQYGTESMVVIAELRGDFDPAAAKAVERRISAAVLSAVGIAPRRVAVVPERWIVKSTAGKISRRETRERFLSEQPNKPS